MYIVKLNLNVVYQIFLTCIHVVQTCNIYKYFIASPNHLYLEMKCLAVFIALEYTANIFLIEAIKSMLLSYSPYLLSQQTVCIFISYKLCQVQNPECNQFYRLIYLPQLTNYKLLLQLVNVVCWQLVLQQNNRLCVYQYNDSIQSKWTFITMS